MRKIFLLLLFFVNSIVSISQSADDIVAKYVAARGGEDSSKAIQTLLMKGSRSINGLVSQVQMVIEQDKFYRMDFEWPWGKGFEVLTSYPTKAGAKMTRKGLVRLSDKEIASKWFRTDIEGGLIDYAAKGHSVALIGKEDVGGKPAYKIKFTSNTGAEVFYWIDVATFFKVQSAVQELIQVKDSSGNWSEKAVQDTIQYQNYRAVNGVLFPFAQVLRQYVAETGQLLLTVSTFYNKIEANLPIPAKLYKLK